MGHSFVRFKRSPEWKNCVKAIITKQSIDFRPDDDIWWYMMIFLHINKKKTNTTYIETKLWFYFIFIKTYILLFYCKFSIFSLFFISHKFTKYDIKIALFLHLFMFVLCFVFFIFFFCLFFIIFLLFLLPVPKMCIL